MSKHVFISYSRKNIGMMQQVDRALRMKGIKTWTDDKLIPGTSQWKFAIEKAIEAAGAIVVLMSPDAKASEWVDRELEYARMRNISIIPLLVEGDAISAVPFELVSSQWIDISSTDKYSEGVTRLVNTLLGLLNLKAKSMYHLLHEALIQFASNLPDLRWVGVISVDGLTIGFYSKTAKIEEDRISAMSAANLSISDRISSELDIGVLRYVVTTGSIGVIFTVGLDDKHVLMFALDQCTSIDKVISSLNEATKPLFEILNISNASLF